MVALQKFKFAVLLVCFLISRKIAEFKHLGSAKLNITNRNPEEKEKNDPLHVTVGCKVMKL